MITCPRCGFEQPKDVFCAKCGVNIEGFAARRPSLAKKFNWPIVGLLFLIVVIGLLYVAYGRKEEPPTSPLAENVEPPKNESIPSAVPVAPPTPAIPAKPIPKPPSNAMGFAESKPPEPPKAAAPEAATVFVEYATLARDLLERVSQEGEGRLEVGHFSISALSQFKTKYDVIAKDPGFKSLASESRPLNMGQTSLVFRGGKEPKSNETIGIFVEVTPTKPMDRGNEFKVSVKRSLPEVTPAGEIKVNSQNFDETVSLPTGYAIALAGVLPRKVLVEGEDELYKSNILRILADPGFQKGELEFVVFINPRFPEAN